ncbi:MAG: endonuclease domain-containing protein [Micromonosporaceae bacterium]
MTGWRANYQVVHHAEVIATVDVAFVASRVAVEIDGWAYHSDPARFQADRRRQNRLVSAGWTVLRFTWHDLTTRPDEVIHTLRSVLRGKISDSGPDV